jgi:hypothetical protein
MGDRTNSRLACFAAIALGAAALAQPPDSPTDRGPLHPRAAPPAVEPNPYFSSDLLRYVEDNLPIQGVSQNRYEEQCYEQLLLHARRLPVDLLRRAATTRINFAHMFNEDRGRYRGALVHIEGRLRMLRQYDPPPTLLGIEDGLTQLYEGWIFVEEFGGNPYCVVCSELPKSLEPSETLDRFVETDAFFFKRYRYGAKDGWRDAPLLIARTIRPAVAPAVRSGSALWEMPVATLAGVVVLIGLTVVTAGGIVWWFRRQDRIARQQVTQALKKNDDAALEWREGNPTG